MHRGSAFFQRLLGHPGEFTGAPGGQQQPRALGRKGQRGGRADARTRSGNEYDLSLETHDLS